MDTFSGSEQFILSLLVGLWAALLFGGWIAGKPDAQTGRRMPRSTRLTSSAVLVTAGWCAWIFTRAELAAFIAAGMTLGFIGDLFMARLLLRSEQYVLGGIGAFGVGHIVYIVGMLSQRTPDNWLPLLVWLLIGAAGWYLVVYRAAASPGTLHLAALPYALLLAGTAGIATALALEEVAFAPVAVGGALFLFSDLVLAAGLFGGMRFRGLDDVVWLTYGPGQMLIVYGAMLAL